MEKWKINRNSNGTPLLIDNGSFWFLEDLIHRKNN